MKLSNKTTNLIASLLLLFVAAITILSMKDDSAIMDEVAHLPAGYSYLTQKDMRINPEHPPLIKDLAAVPLLFIKNIRFPSEIKSWAEGINDQWDFGANFLYNFNNPADEMIFWGRIPMILILLILGFYIFKVAREFFGNEVAILSLFLFSFSPTFLAHGRFVTTDVGAATGAFISIYYFLKALKNPSLKNILLSGFFFGLAELAKFTTIILVPFFFIVAFFWWLAKIGKLWKTLKILLLTFLIGFILIWPVYAYHIWGYPKERQTRDTDFIAQTFPLKGTREALVWGTENPILRPYAQYFLGLSMVFQRGTGGNTGYFMGEVSNRGWKTYFPTVYLLKEPLAFHFLSLVALLYAIFLARKFVSKNFVERIKKWLQGHFVEFAFLTFIASYWAGSLISNLNIGVRHLLPAIPFTFILVSLMVVKLLEGKGLRAKAFILALLLAWQAASVLSVYPSFLAYANEIAGGPSNLYKYVVDSNLDWGQDLKRLSYWVKENNIDRIYVDYFGGGSPKYYLKEKALEWHGNYNPNDFPKGNYFAISATFLQGGNGKAVPGFDQSTGFYRWLGNFNPVAVIGHSIFVYYIE